MSPEYVKIPMEAGTLLIMEGCVQEDWQVSTQPNIKLITRTVQGSTSAKT